MKKRKILSLLLCIVMLLSVLALPACNADPDTDKKPSDQTENDGTPPADPDKDQKPAENTNPLQGKTVIWNGDSICYGSSAHGNWATRVAANNELKAWKNYGVGGATIVENAPRYQSGGERHSVCATLEQMYEEYPDADYVILEGGTNDADLLGKITGGTFAVRCGAFAPDDFSGDYDTETFCGALESIFYRAKQYWPDAKICFIVAQKMGTNTSTSNNRYAYFEIAMQICEKWDIPYLNLWDNSDLDPTQPDMYDPNKTAEENEQTPYTMYRDGQHLTAAGYDYTTDIIDKWLKTL